MRFSRRIPIPLLLLILALIASQLLLWWMQPEPKPRQSFGPPRSGYTLDGFSLDILTRNGKAGMRLSSPHLQRRDADSSLYIDAPRFSLPGNDGSQWLGQSDSGWVSADAALLKLHGSVRLRRPATATIATASIFTTDVTAKLDLQQLQTAARAEIHEPGRIIAGTGMKVDLVTHTMELLADVHGTLQPEATH